MIECPCDKCERCEELKNVKPVPYKLWRQFLYDEARKRRNRDVFISGCPKTPVCDCLVCNDSLPQLDMGCGCIAGKCVCCVCLEPENATAEDHCYCGCSRSEVGNPVYTSANDGCIDEDHNKQPCLCHLPFPVCEVPPESNDDCSGCEFCIKDGLLKFKTPLKEGDENCSH